MAVKHYLDIDVYTAAKQRINHIIDTHDTLMVLFSGGKDSLLVLNLVQEVYNERGITKKVKVVFLDEELIPDNVVEYVQGICESGLYDFRYYCIPLKAQKYVLGEIEDYIQWDPNREWIRQPPTYAIQLAKGDNSVYSLYDAYTYFCKDEKGTVALINGIRTDESVLRLQGLLNKINEPYISSTKMARVHQCKPIYDWSTKDLLLYFFKNKIQYCNIYQEQFLNGEDLRVSPSLTTEGAKNFTKLRTRCPNYYNQVVSIFPEMMVQDRYYKDFKQGMEFAEYEHSIAGAYKLVEDTYTDPILIKKARKMIRQVDMARKASPPNIKNNFSLYPLLRLFKVLAASEVKYGMMLPFRDKLTKQMIDFEKTKEE